jgi:hypothetical protein
VAAESRKPQDEYCRHKLLLSTRYVVDILKYFVPWRPLVSTRMHDPLLANKFTT